MTSLTTLPQMQLPAAFQGLNLGGNRDLSAGLPDAFAILTGRGKQFIIKHRQIETPLNSTDGAAYQHVDVVMLKASAAVSKIYYAGAFSPGDDGPPDCWSVDGVAPDAAAASKQSTTCAGCKHNVFGSKITPQGTAIKACGDSRRLVVVPAADIPNESFGGPMLFRVPPASLKNLAAYATELDRVGIHYVAVMTRIRFDPQVTYPQYLFEYLGMVNENQAQQIVAMLANPMIDRMLTASGFVGTPAPTAPVPMQPTAITPPAPAAAGFAPVQPLVALAPPTAPAPVLAAPPTPPVPVLNPQTGQWELPPQAPPAPAAPPTPPVPVFNAQTGQWELPGQVTIIPPSPTPGAATTARRRPRATAQPAVAATPAPQPAAVAPVVAAPIPTTVTPFPGSAAPLGPISSVLNGPAVTPLPPAPAAPTAQPPSAILAVQPAPSDVASLVGDLLRAN